MVKTSFLFNPFQILYFFCNIFQNIRRRAANRRVSLRASAHAGVVTERNACGAISRKAPET